MKLEKKAIYEAYPMLVRLARMRLPVRASVDAATIIKKLTPAYEVLSGEGNKLIKQHGTEDPKTKQIGVRVGTASMDKYEADLKVMLEGEWDEDLSIKKVKLPDVIAGSCDKCHHNLDIKFLIEPEILVPLVDLFVEV